MERIKACTDVRVANGCRSCCRCWHNPGSLRLDWCWLVSGDRIRFEDQDLPRLKTGWRQATTQVQTWSKAYAIMSDQFFYLQLKFTPKIGHTAPITNEREVVVEVPKDLVRKQSELINENLREVIALDLARRAALGTFPNVAERAIGRYDEDLPTWHKDRPRVMNERPCDHEENGTRAWRIV
jgi:hypothetical protein